MAKPKRSEPERLSDILLYARTAQMFGQELGFAREKFDASSLYRCASIRCLEVIGEASKYLSSDTKDGLPQVEWKKMAGMRDILIHNYYEVNLDIVWGAVIKNIPPLIEALEPVVDED